MSLYIIGIGGTGAKCIEAVIQLAAVGLLTQEPIRVLFVDADETNGNLERARSSLGIYKKCYELLIGGDKQQSPWLKTPIESLDLWSPFDNRSTQKNLGSFFNYNSLSQNYQALGYLFDVLYTKDEREVTLDVGFRGRPAIGSAIMSQVDLDDLEEEPWGTMLKLIQADVGGGKSPKIFLCGSIFGGTGASGLPTLGRLISNKLRSLNVRDRVKIGCLFVLPYFGFSPPPGEDPDGVYARAEQFLLNTEAALRYYVTQAQQTFNTVYLLGNQNLSQVKFSIGKNTQRNEPHFIELYAGLAARQFLLNTPSEPGTVVLISRRDIGRLIWQDLPELTIVKPALVNGTRFAFAWLANIAPELAVAKKIGVDSFQKGAPWFSKFFRPSQGILGSILIRKGEELPDFNEAKEQEAIGIVSNWCKDYLRWLSELHECESDRIELFMMNIVNGLKGEDLPNLVFGDNRDKTRQAKDTVQQLRERLDPQTVAPPNQGTVGLAKSLYILSRLN